MPVSNGLGAVATLGTVGLSAYAYHVYSLIRSTEPVPEPLAAKLVSSVVPSRVADGTCVGTVARAYQAPSVLPTHEDVVAVFGQDAIAQQSFYIAADGEKRVQARHAQTHGSGALGSLFALQALERSTPLRQQCALALFTSDFTISRQWNRWRHLGSGSQRAVRAVVHDAESAVLAKAALDSYCSRAEHAVDDVAVEAAPAQRHASIETKFGTCVGAAIDPPSAEQSAPRAVMVRVVHVAPIPVGVAPDSFSAKVRTVWADWYTRWLTASTARTVSQL